MFGSVICYYAICAVSGSHLLHAVSGSVIYYCVIRVNLGSIGCVTVQYGLCLAVSFVMVQYQYDLFRVVPFITVQYG